MFPRMQPILNSIAQSDKHWAKNARMELEQVFQSANLGQTDGFQDSAVLVEDLGQIVLERYAIRERYLRNVETLAPKAEEITDWMVTTYKEMTSRFVESSFERIRADIKEEHRWYTGFQDTAGQMADSIGQMKKWVESKVTSSSSTDTEDLMHTFVSKQIEKHFSEEIFKGFCEKTDSDLNEHVTKWWGEAYNEVVGELNISWSKLNRRKDVSFLSDMPSVLDHGSATAIIGLSAAATSTVVLAAGWHTLAWSISGLFLPLLPVIIAASIGAAFMGKARSLEKILSTVEDQETKLKQSLLDTIEYRTRAEFKRSNDETADNFKDLTFRRVVGNFDSKLLDQFIRNLEDTLDDILEEDTPFDNDTVRDKGWLQRGRSALDGGDDLAAAMYGSLAFEQLLREINRKHSVGFNFRVPHHNRMFIEALTRKKVIPPEQISKLRSLKSRRDQFTHRMHQIAAMGEGRRMRLIKSFLKDISIFY